MAIMGFENAEVRPSVYGTVQLPGERGPAFEIAFK